MASTATDAQLDRAQAIVSRAKTVEDMGRRVAAVLEEDPRDLMYADSKTHEALLSAVEILALAGWDLDRLLDVVREAHAEGVKHR